MCFSPSLLPSTPLVFTDIIRNFSIVAVWKARGLVAMVIATASMPLSAMTLPCTVCRCHNGIMAVDEPFTTTEPSSELKTLCSLQSRTSSNNERATKKKAEFPDRFFFFFLMHA